LVVDELGGTPINACPENGSMKVMVCSTPLWLLLPPPPPQALSNATQPSAIAETWNFIASLLMVVFLSVVLMRFSWGHGTVPREHASGKCFRRDALDGYWGREGPGSADGNRA
jgi:hypothetical protein